MKNNPFIVLLILVSIMGCSTPKMLMHHHPDEIIVRRVDPTFIESDFNGRTIVLSLVNDLSMQPVGAYLDNDFNNINPVEQSYTMSNPGHVVFEKFAESLKNHNASVYRSYSSNDDVSSLEKGSFDKVEISISNVEFYFWDKKLKNPDESSFYLSKVEVILTVNGWTDRPRTIISKVHSEDDVFVASAEQLSKILSDHLSK